MTKNTTSILILQGWVMYIGKGQTMIQCPTSGRFDVKWKDDTLPDIQKGQYVTITGKLITLDLARSFVVVHAEILKAKSLNKIKKFIMETRDALAHDALVDRPAATPRRVYVHKKAGEGSKAAKEKTDDFGI